MVNFCVAHLERGKDDKSVAILVSIISGDTIGCILWHSKLIDWSNFPLLILQVLFVQSNIDFWAATWYFYLFLCWKFGVSGVITSGWIWVKLTHFRDLMQLYVVTASLSFGLPSGSGSVARVSSPLWEKKLTTCQKAFKKVERKGVEKKLEAKSISTRYVIFCVIHFATVVTAAPLVQPFFLYVRTRLRFLWFFFCEIIQLG